MTADTPERIGQLDRHLLAATALRLLLFMALAHWLLGPFLAHAWAPSDAHDWTYFMHHAEAARRSMVEYGQLPAWNPYHCGGVPGVANVQTNTTSPFFLLFVVPFGVGPGFRIAIWAYAVLAMEGAWRYASKHGLSGLSALTCAVGFGACGRFAQSIYDGQPTFFAFALLPWVVLAFERGLRDWRWAVGGGLFMAWVFLESGSVATPLIGYWLLLMSVGATAWALLSPACGWRWWRPVATLTLMTAIALGLTAFRALPAAVSLSEHPRIWMASEHHTLGAVIDMMTATTVDGTYSGPGTSFIGAAFLALAFYGMLRGRRTARFGCLLGAIAIWTAMGAGRYDLPWALLKQLPVLENMRNAWRFTFVATLFVALAAGAGVAAVRADAVALLDRLRRSRGDGTAEADAAVRDGERDGVAPTWSGLVGLVAAVATTTLLLQPLLAHNHGRIVSLEYRDPLISADWPFRQSLGNRWDAHVWPAMNLGTLSCFEEQPFRTSPRLRGDLEAEERLADPSKGSVERVSWSPNAIVLDVALEEPALILVNQNWHRGWRASRGETVIAGGLLAVRAPAGRYSLELSYLDPWMLAGGAISVLMLVSLLGSWVWIRRRRIRDR